MRSATSVLALAFLLSSFCVAQSRDQAAGDDAAAQAQRLLSKTREAVGGESKLKQVRALSFSGKYHRRHRSGGVTGEIRVDLLAPDKILMTEDSNPRPAVFVTVLQAMNGDQVWIDRKTHRPAGDDGSAEFARRQEGRTSPIATESGGMRDVTRGSTTVRTNPPGANTTERTILGMPLPSSQGRDLDTEAKKMEAARSASATRDVPSNRPPGIENPGVRSALERQIRKELTCLMFALLITPPSSMPFEFAYAGSIQSDQGVVEAIEISGSNQFAARLFVDQKTSLPLMLSYGDLVRRSEERRVGKRDG